MSDRTRLLILISIVLMYTKSAKSNNDPPRFLMLSENEILLQMREGAETPVGSKILTLTGDDPDGDNLQFGVRGQAGNELLRIESVNSTTAEMFLKRELDRETQDSYQLILTLSDGHLGNVIERSLYILVEDVNDNRPVFKPYNTTIYIKEGSPPGIIDVNLEATDLDEGIFGQVLYSLQETGENSEHFKIDTVNGAGVLSLVSTLDYEEKHLYQLQVLATDMSNVPGGRHTGTAAIVIMVEDVEDQPPEFIRVPSVTKIPEDLPVLSRILQVLAIDGDRGINNAIHYSLVEGGNDLFGIERETGWAFVKNRLDRESINGDSNGAYILRIRAEEVSSRISEKKPSVETEVTVILIDVNDETPRFRSDNYIGEISENTQLNVPVTFLGSARPEVYDHDQGKNGTFSLTLSGDDGAFDITPSEGINEATFLLRVKNHTILDYEKRKEIRFKIIAHEVGGVGEKRTTTTTTKWSSANVTVHIRDANDNVPEFEADDYVAHVLENSSAGMSVVKVRARDPDSGNFGDLGLRYTEIRGQVAHRLMMDSVTGEITVKDGQGEDFDREQFTSYFLTVEVRDDLGRGNRNTVQLRLVIDDVNDNAPRFMQTHYEARINENVGKFAHPILVEAFDRDLEGTPNGMIRFKIVDGDPFGNFSIDAMTGEIVPAAPLDFEAVDGIVDGHRHFTLTVLATDLGIPPLDTKVSVVIYVQDKNDHAPVFLQSSYNANIREDAKQGDSVVRVNATDGDGSIANSRIVYRIVSEVQDKFVINAENGLITITQGANLDPDLTNPKTFNHVLRVAAFDGGIGIEQKHSVVFVNVSVMDVNNKSPEFKAMDTVTALENSIVGTVITQLQAIDLDNNPELYFTLEPDRCEAKNEYGVQVQSSRLTSSGSGCRGLFDVTSDGLVKVKSALDREHIETVQLSVTVQDLNAYGSKQEAKGTLTVKIVDVNDNDPTFDKGMYRRAVHENSAPGTHVVTVVATDRDANRTVTYHLDGNDEQHNSLVTLDSHTGEIVVSGKFDRETYSWLNFSVIATDNGVPKRSNTARVLVQIIDENDNNPVFPLDDNYVFGVPENSPGGTEIAKIHAIDADSGEYGKITYVLDKNAAEGKFTIDPNTGVLAVAGQLDRETKDKYSLVVEAWDNYDQGFATGESRKAFKQIIVTVLDVNDETPVLLNSELHECASITEYHGVGELVTMVKFDDADDPETPNGQVDVTIIEGNVKGLFSLERNIDDDKTTRLIVSKSLKQQVGNHTVSLGLTDRGTPKLTRRGELIVCVTDFNDHAPRFIRPLQNQTIRIAENTSIGSVLVQMAAVDDDMGLNGQIRYRIVEDKRQDWRTFEIDAANGTIKLRKSLDRESQKKYEIRVEARDLGDPTPLSSDMDLHFYVTNIIDVEPQFRLPEVEILFTESTKPKAEMQVLPETVDTEEYESDSEKAPICYFIVFGNQEHIFHVDPLSHVVTLTTQLDREVRAKYEFVVRASKDCQEEQRNETTLTPMSSSVNGLSDIAQFLKNRSYMKVVVNVLDINDNAPRFVKPVFTGGMSTELATYGTIVLQVQATDADFGANGRVTYHVDGIMMSSLSSSSGGGSNNGVSNPADFVQSPPFIVNRTSGEVLLNFYPQKNVKGYFHFKVVANDSLGQNDTARVTIYLVREDQKVTFTLRLAPDELRPRIDHFQRMLSNLTGMIVNVDLSKYHENKDGSVDRTKTDILTHFVQKDDNSIVNVKTVVDLIDDRIEALNALFREYNVLECKPTVGAVSEVDANEILLAGLVGTATCLLVLLLLSISICLHQRNGFKRQLRAATVVAFGSQMSSLHRTNVPNTNQHSNEGSNPIWMHSYENDWYKGNDVISVGGHSTIDDGCNNSLDENDVIEVTTDEANSSTSRYSSSRTLSETVLEPTTAGIDRAVGHLQNASSTMSTTISTEHGSSAGRAIRTNNVVVKSGAIRNRCKRLTNSPLSSDDDVDKGTTNGDLWNNAGKINGRSACSGEDQRHEQNDLNKLQALSSQSLLTARQRRPNCFPYGGGDDDAIMLDDDLMIDSMTAINGGLGLPPHRPAAINESLLMSMSSRHHLETTEL